MNPADPLIIMRDTIFCPVAADAEENRVRKSIEEMVQEVSSYVPGPAHD